jgi:hypothetical protein
MTRMIDVRETPRLRRFFSGGDGGAGGGGAGGGGGGARQICSVGAISAGD